MFIQTESTPNPETLKFLPGRDVYSLGTIEFKSEEGAKDSPLAASLFSQKGVKSVFFGQDFITITKTEEMSWDLMKPSLLSVIMEHFSSNKPVIADDSKLQSDTTTNYEGLDEIEKQIAELIDNRVRPAVAMDGGDIIYRGFENGIVKLELYGSCSGCPSSTATLKSGIENMLKHYVPEVIAVEAIN